MDSASRYELGRKATWLGIIGNIILTIIKAIAGLLAGSLAMVADAFHSLSDLLSSFVVLWGLKFSQRPPDEDHHYGHGKAESIVAKLVAIFLVLTACGIGLSAYKGLKDVNISSPGQLALWAALISIIAKEAMYQYTIRIAKKIDSSAVRADAWHHRSDAMSSIAALVGIGGAILGWPILDPIAGLVVAIMIAYTGVEIYWSAVRELMDEAPDPELITRIRELAETIDGVRQAYDLRGRYNGPALYLDMKICVDAYATVEHGHNLAALAKRKIMEEYKEVANVLIHVNPCAISQGQLNCSLCGEKCHDIQLECEHK